MTPPGGIPVDSAEDIRRTLQRERDAALEMVRELKAERERLRAKIKRLAEGTR